MIILVLIKMFLLNNVLKSSFYQNSKSVHGHVQDRNMYWIKTLAVRNSFKNGKLNGNSMSLSGEK